MNSITPAKNIPFIDIKACIISVLDCPFRAPFSILHNEHNYSLCDCYPISNQFNQGNMPQRLGDHESGMMSGFFQVFDQAIPGPLLPHFFQKPISQPQGTFVMPSGSSKPSLFQTPRLRMRLEWHRLKSKIGALRG